MKILIVEDNAVNSRILELSLQKHNYQTITAQNGKEALDRLKADTDVQLVVADIMMPEMDGIELLTTMQEQPELESIPVIMCTALGDKEMALRAAKLGCEHYLLKPIDPRDLVARVGEVLAEQQPILRDRAWVESTLGLDDAAYGEVAAAFSAEVSRALELLGRDNGGGAASQRQWLAQLTESATMLGAERVWRIIDNLVGAELGAGPDTTRREENALRAELKRLQNALTAELSSIRSRPLPGAEGSQAGGFVTGPKPDTGQGSTRAAS